MLDGAGKVVKSAELVKGAKSYELGMLKPGAYSLRFTAAGYPTLTVKVEVKARHDLHVNIEFEGQLARPPIHR